MANSISWIHADNLNPNQLALEDGDPAIFVWDEALLKEWDISFKRIVFIYECLIELPVVIRRGDVAEEVIKFAQEHGATEILTPESPSPRHKQIIRTIEATQPNFEVIIAEDYPFIDYYGHIDLKRFSRYWRKVEKYAMKPTKK